LALRRCSQPVVASASTSFTRHCGTSCLSEP
jgi:hypothetical protein